MHKPLGKSKFRSRTQNNRPILFKYVNVMKKEENKSQKLLQIKGDLDKKTKFNMCPGSEKIAREDLVGKLMNFKILYQC